MLVMASRFKSRNLLGEGKMKVASLPPHVHVRGMRPRATPGRSASCLCATLCPSSTGSVCQARSPQSCSPATIRASRSLKACWVSQKTDQPNKHLHGLKHNHNATQPPPPQVTTVPTVVSARSLGPEFTLLTNPCPVLKALRQGPTILRAQAPERGGTGGSSGPASSSKVPR